MLISHHPHKNQVNRSPHEKQVNFDPNTKTKSISIHTKIKSISKPPLKPSQFDPHSKLLTCLYRLHPTLHSKWSMTVASYIFFARDSIVSPPQTRVLLIGPGCCVELHFRKSGNVPRISTVSIDRLSHIEITSISTTHTTPKLISFLHWNQVKFHPHWNQVNVDHPHKNEVNFDADTKTKWVSTRIQTIPPVRSTSWCHIQVVRINRIPAYYLLRILPMHGAVFVSGHRNRLDIRVVIEIDLISVMGSKLTWLMYGSKLTWFCARAENDCFYCGDRLTWFLCRWSK